MWNFMFVQNDIINGEFDVFLCFVECTFTNLKTCVWSMLRQKNLKTIWNMEEKIILKLKIHMGEIMRLNVHMGISWWKNIVCQNIIHKWWLRQICEKFVQNDIINWESDDFFFECIFNRWFPVFEVCRVQKVLKYAEKYQNYFLPIKISVPCIGGENKSSGMSFHNI